MGQQARHDGVTLITGAAGGMGAAVAARLAARGDRVALLDRDPKGLEPVAKALGHDEPPEPGRTTPDGACSVHVADVASREQVEEAVRAVEEHQGPVTALVNAAGVLHTGDLTDYDDEAWHHTLAVNATGVFVVSTAVARRMRERRSGAIVTIASNAARVPRAHMGAYAASKAASQSLTLTLGLELGPLGIRCNVVAPGSTDTPMLRSMWSGEQDRAATLEGDPAAFRVGIPLGKVAVPDDIAHTVAFLLSPEANHITLATVAVDGGAALGAA
ncbi:SDR family NAD(P)-dependent oxidoreductase [Streptantibioticus parmotrematis]|uniref:SDR family NAD(P)-dependent oxidoreductase n=1 Tax=Streptantibioticus parmotrematis TaxID=2873249 RepID=UPI0034055EBE